MATRRALLRAFLLAFGALALLVSTVPASAADAAWPKYLHDNGGTSYTPDGGITPAAAARLASRPCWPVKLGATISTQPVLANGLIYVGAWNGNEVALTPSGTVQWSRFLGITTKGKACQYPIGIAGTAAIADIPARLIGGGQGVGSRSVVYVGGGGNADAAGHTVSGGTAQLFALDALDGTILWHTALGS